MSGYVSTLDERRLTWEGGAQLFFLLATHLSFGLVAQRSVVCKDAYHQTFKLGVFYVNPLSPILALIPY